MGKLLDDGWCSYRDRITVTFYSFPSPKCRMSWLSHVMLHCRSINWCDCVSLRCQYICVMLFWTQMWLVIDYEALFNMSRNVLQQSSPKFRESNSCFDGCVCMCVCVYVTRVNTGAMCLCHIQAWFLVWRNWNYIFGHICIYGMTTHEIYIYLIMPLVVWITILVGRFFNMEQGSPLLPPHFESTPPPVTPSLGKHG